MGRWIIAHSPFRLARPTDMETKLGVVHMKRVLRRRMRAMRY